jgi:hypothetical protein
MANVFISHSSVDKPFVRNLATKLLAEGIPVWLDAWELNFGDSLLDRIYEGIENSGALLLVMSKNSIASGWVNRELNAALTMEQRSGRIFVIPLRLDDSSLPLKVDGRLYADFSSGFSASLAALTQTLRKMKLLDQRVDPQRELLPLSFSRQIHLDKASFTKAVGHIRARQTSIKLLPEQIVINDDADFIELSRRLHDRIDHIEKDPWFTPDLESHLKGTATQIERLTGWLREGIALLVNNGAATETVYWYAHLMRSQAVHSLWGSQSPGAGVMSYGEKVPQADLSSNHGAMKYFESDDLVPAVIWANEDEINGDNAHTFYVPRSELTQLLTPSGAYAGAVDALRAISYEAFSRYMYPQVVYRAIRDGRVALPWRLSEAWVGMQ